MEALYYRKLNAEDPPHQWIRVLAELFEGTDEQIKRIGLIEGTPGSGIYWIMSGKHCVPVKKDLWIVRDPDKRLIRYTTPRHKFAENHVAFEDVFMESAEQIAIERLNRGE